MCLCVGLSALIVAAETECCSPCGFDAFVHDHAGVVQRRGPHSMSNQLQLLRLSRLDERHDSNVHASWVTAVLHILKLCL
jgi:hypothetical protein